MAANTKIEWCDATWNPWRGCTRISEGCRFCYAETLSARNPKVLGVWGPKGTRVVASEAKWREPVKWDRLAAAGKLPDGSPNPGGHQPRVFCASLADVFEDWAGPMSDAGGQPIRDADGWYSPLAERRPLTMDDVRRRLFDLIDATPHLDWLLVTKRPENAARMTPPYSGPDECNKCLGECRCPRPNVWLIASVENQEAADRRIPELLKVPAVVRGLSVEPLLGPVTLGDNLYPRISQMRGVFAGKCAGRSVGIDWVIVGAESGPGARPCDVEWVRSIVAQCRAAGVPVFCKQLGARPYVTNSAERFDWPASVGWEVRSEDPRDPATVRTWFVLADPKGGDPAEWTPDLRVRQFPTPAGA